jgi:hypothetical protein
MIVPYDGGGSALSECNGRVTDPSPPDIVLAASL